MQAFLLCAFLTLLLGSAQSATTGTVRTEEAKTPWFCHDLDCPPFSVEDASVDTDIELRSYDAGRASAIWMGNGHGALQACRGAQATGRAKSGCLKSSRAADLIGNRHLFICIPLTRRSVGIGPRARTVPVRLSLTLGSFPQANGLRLTCAVTDALSTHTGQWASTNVSDTSYDSAVRTGFWVSG